MTLTNCCDSTGAGLLSGEAVKAPDPREDEFACRVAEVEYSLVRTDADRDAVYRLRHFVLVETDRYFPDEGKGRICDRFDGIPETQLIQARAGGSLVGSVRLVLDGPRGVPSYSFFDVPAAIRNLTGTGAGPVRVGDLNRIVVDRGWRNKQIGFWLMAVGHYLGIRAGVTHFVGVANPRTLTLFVDRLGWRTVGEQSLDDCHGVPYVPIVGVASEVKALKAGPRTGRM
jgi:hypothetical protein